MISPIVLTAALFFTVGTLHFFAKLFIHRFVWTSPSEQYEAADAYADAYVRKQPSLSSQHIHDDLVVIRSHSFSSKSMNEEVLSSWKLSTKDLKFTLSNCPSSSNSTNTNHQIDDAPDIQPITGVTIPGQVHTDLIAAGVIPKDPYFRFAERELAWITNKCWQYESEPFLLYEGNHMSSKDESHASSLYLRFDAVDTVASYYINDILIGTSENAFRPHTFQIPLFLQNELLNRQSSSPTKGSRLKILLHSTATKAKELASQYPYSVPATENYNVWAEPTSRNFVRKAGSDFGWDWGPAFIPMGIMNNVEFYASSVGKLDGFIVHQDLSPDLQSAVLNVKVYLGSIPPSSDISTSLEVFLNEVLVQKTPVVLNDHEASEFRVEIPPITVKEPELWWPRSCGKQNLYTVKVVYAGAQVIEKKIGIRLVELIQEPVVSQLHQKPPQLLGNGLYTVQPATFYLKVNGVPLFMRGANYIPSDSFRSRISVDDKLYVLNAAASSNMNMIRVWGGGIYEDDNFYSLADEMGIMVWQEIMLACALYPRNENFLHEIANEVQHQALKLGDHPSIVVWGGNNENEVALGWFSQSLENRDLYVADYSKLYADTVFPSLQTILGHFMPRRQAIWVDSSPSNGLLSVEDPYVKLWGQASTSAAGDMHFYDYNCDCENAISFPQSRFVSEFGFQSMPSFLSYEAVTLPQDWMPNSELLLYRQRHQDGNEQIDSQLSLHFMKPQDSSNCPSGRKDYSTEKDINFDSKRYFDMYLYLTGLQQSRCYETAINRWRQMRGIRSLGTSDISTDKNSIMMGILYWQLNDIWQGPSWSSMEWSGRWKPLLYSVRRAFAPLVITMAPISSDAAVSSNIKNDTFFSFSIYAVDDNILQADDDSEEQTVAIKVELLHTMSTHTADNFDYTVWQRDVNVPKNTAILVEKDISITEDILHEAECSMRTCYLKLSAATVRDVSDGKGYFESTIPTSTIFMEEVKNMQFNNNPEIMISNVKQLSPKEVSFEVQVSVTSPFLFLELRSSQEPGVGDEGGGIYSTIAAGWFSDNNFLAEAQRKYSLTYTSHVAPVNKEDFTQNLQARVLQHAYNCELSLIPSFL